MSASAKMALWKFFNRATGLLAFVSGVDFGLFTTGQVPTARSSVLATWVVGGHTHQLMWTPPAAPAVPIARHRGGRKFFNRAPSRCAVPVL